MLKDIIGQKFSDCGWFEVLECFEQNEKLLIWLNILWLIRLFVICFIFCSIYNQFFEILINLVQFDVFIFYNESLKNRIISWSISKLWSLIVLFFRWCISFLLNIICWLTFYFLTYKALLWLIRKRKSRSFSKKSTLLPFIACLVLHV